MSALRPDFLALTLDFHLYLTEYKIGLIVEDSKNTDQTTIKFVEQGVEHQVNREKRKA